jgi:hypothetical protein
MAISRIIEENLFHSVLLPGFSKMGLEREFEASDWLSGFLPITPYLAAHLPLLV